MLVDKPLRELLEALAARTPTPGGGSAAAAAAAMGTALLVMVASLPKTRSGSTEEREALAAAASALIAVQRQLTDAVDSDAAAYADVVSAYRLARTTGPEQSARAAAIARSLRGATDVPLGVMRSAATALQQAIAVSANGYRPAASDARTGIALLGAALQSARWNVEANVEQLADPQYADSVRTESARLVESGAAATKEAERLLLGI
jgi:glutamate formiminotransferase/formiminotetrahydrofolate cyclodeaminase